MYENGKYQVTDKRGCYEDGVQKILRGKAQLFMTASSHDREG